MGFVVLWYDDLPDDWLVWESDPALNNSRHNGEWGLVWRWVVQHIKSRSEPLRMLTAIIEEVSSEGS